MAITTDEQTVRCGTCGQLNRINELKLAQGLHPKCGNCRESLFATTAPIHINENNFSEMVEKANIPVLVDFWADWCGPCHALAPVVEQLSAEFAESVRVAKVNTDENQGLAARFQIRGIPALLLFINGKVVDRMVGALPKQQIVARLQHHLRQRS